MRVKWEACLSQEGLQETLPVCSWRLWLYLHLVGVISTHFRENRRRDLGAKPLPCMGGPLPLCDSLFLFF